MSDWIDEMPEEEMRQRYRKVCDFSDLMTKQATAAHEAMKAILRTSDIAEAKRLAYVWIEENGGVDG